MNRWGFFNILLILALAVVIGALFVLHTNTKARNGYMIEGMVHSPAPGDYSASTFFPDGKTLQEPVEGSVARTSAAIGGDGAEEEVSSNPFRPTAEVLERGELIFKRDCMVCHGAGALGDGSVVKKGFPGPPSLLDEHARGLSDSAIFHLVSAGGAIMPSYAAQIAPADRWKAILYVRSLQKKAPSPKAASGETAPWPGTALMAKSDCLACHAVDHRVVGPAFREVAARYHQGDHLAALVAKVKAGGSGNWGAIPMPAHPDLSDAELQAMVGSVLGLGTQGAPGGAK
jgi:cytochrome c551/c552